MTSSSSRATSSFLPMPKLLYQCRRGVPGLGGTGDAGCSGDEAWPITMPLSSKLTRAGFFFADVGSSGWRAAGDPAGSVASSEGEAPRDGLVCFKADFLGDIDRGGGECLTSRLSLTSPKCAVLTGLLEWVLWARATRASTGTGPKETAFRSSAGPSSACGATSVGSSTGTACATGVGTTVCLASSDAAIRIGCSKTECLIGMESSASKTSCGTAWLPWLSRLSRGCSPSTSVSSSTVDGLSLSIGHASACCALVSTSGRKFDGERGGSWKDWPDALRSSQAGTGKTAVAAGSSTTGSSTGRGMIASLAAGSASTGGGAVSDS